VRIRTGKPDSRTCISSHRWFYLIICAHVFFIRTRTCDLEMSGELNVGSTWTLRRLGLELGQVAITSADFPWLHGTWQPTEEFATYAHLFAAELEISEQLMDSDDGDWDTWETAYQAIVDQEIHLHYPDGRIVPEFLLHIVGDTAWFRWSDEPFD
jgi:hypothetical protein